MGETLPMNEHPADHRIRRVEPGDVPAVVGLVHELATYERAADECHLTEEQLETALFGDASRCTATSPSSTVRSSGARCGS